jgi:hypothetical protein
MVFIGPFRFFRVLPLDLCHPKRWIHRRYP